MRRRILTVGACLCLVMLAVAVWISRDQPTGTDASGSTDTIGQQTAPDDGTDGPLAGQQAPAGQESAPGAPAAEAQGAQEPPNGSAAKSAVAPGPAPADFSTTAGPANGGSAGAAAGATNGSKASGSDSPVPPPDAQSGPALPVYSSADFYHWQWSPQSRSPLSWSFTNSVPSAWRFPISTAARSWNAERRSLQYAAPDGDVSTYPPRGCDTKQLDTNGVHRTSLDGPNGIVATTYSCIDATTAEAVSIQVVIDADDRWFTGNTPSAPGEYDLIGAVAHEFGHATGWEGHYAPHDPRCTSSAHPERMCPALATGSTAWRTTGLTDKAVFGSAY